jgi:hypothetical protein
MKKIIMFLESMQETNPSPIIEIMLEAAIALVEGKFNVDFIMTDQQGNIRVGEMSSVAEIQGNNPRVRTDIIQAAPTEQLEPAVATAVNRTVSQYIQLANMIKGEMDMKSMNPAEQNVVNLMKMIADGSRSPKIKANVYSPDPKVVGTTTIEIGIDPGTWTEWKSQVLDIIREYPASSLGKELNMARIHSTDKELGKLNADIRTGFKEKKGISPEQKSQQSALRDQLKKLKGSTISSEDRLAAIDRKFEKASVNATAPQMSDARRKLEDLFAH